MTDVEECLERVVPAARVAEAAAWFAPFTVEDLLAMGDAAIAEFLILRGDGLTFPVRFLYRYLQAARTYHCTHPTPVLLSAHQHVTCVCWHERVLFSRLCIMWPSLSCSCTLPSATRVGTEEAVVVLAWWMATISDFDSQYTGELRHHHFGVYTFGIRLFGCVNTTSRQHMSKTHVVLTSVEAGSGSDLPCLASSRAQTCNQFVLNQSNSFEFQNFSAVDTVHNALLVPSCTDEQRARVKSAGKKLLAVFDFQYIISKKLARAPKPEDTFWEVRPLLRSRSLFFCLNNIAASIVLEVRGGGICGSALLDEGRESMRNGHRSGRMNVEFHGMVHRL